MASSSTCSPISNAQARPAAAGVQGRGRAEYLPLYRAALSGDWITAKSILDQDLDAARAGFTFHSQKILHVAVGTGKAISFVENLVNILDDDSLKLTDDQEYNALHVAAVTGNTEAAKILVARLPGMLYVPSIHGFLPVHIAAMSAHRDTLDYLISETKDDFRPSPYDGQSGLMLVNLAIYSGFLDIALKLVNKYPDLAKMKLPSGTMVLHVIVQKYSVFASGARFNFWERLIYSSEFLFITD